MTVLASSLAALVTLVPTAAAVDPGIERPDGSEGRPLELTGASVRIGPDGVITVRADTNRADLTWYAFDEGPDNPVPGGLEVAFLNAAETREYGVSAGDSGCEPYYTGPERGFSFLPTATPAARAPAGPLATFRPAGSGPHSPSARIVGGSVFVSLPWTAISQMRLFCTRVELRHVTNEIVGTDDRGRPVRSTFSDVAEGLLDAGPFAADAAFEWIPTPDFSSVGKAEWRALATAAGVSFTTRRRRAVSWDGTVVRKPITVQRPAAGALIARGGGVEVVSLRPPAPKVPCLTARYPQTALARLRPRACNVSRDGTTQPALAFYDRLRGIRWRSYGDTRAVARAALLPNHAPFRPIRTTAIFSRPVASACGPHFSIVRIRTRYGTGRGRLPRPVCRRD